MRGEAMYVRRIYTDDKWPDWALFNEAGEILAYFNTWREAEAAKAVLLNTDNANEYRAALAAFKFRAEPGDGY
jgi:hypothetical protein